MCDSAVLASWLLDAPDELGERVRTTRREATRAPASTCSPATATGILATTWGDTLSVLVGTGGVAVASEPYDDDPGWRDIPDRSLLIATPDGVAVTDLGEV